ncbi:hypothetical protein [Pectobacterium brasiliense]|uniref:hypothetical protein n=1 Tax=Pectobacterium brasiliense TaxID=180957 RepID=UPI003985E735
MTETVKQIHMHPGYSHRARSKHDNPVEKEHQTSHGDGGDGGGLDMNNRMSKIEAVTEIQGKIISETRNEMIGIRGDIHGLERRIIDKMDENHKWVISLIISSILVPLLIALVTK